MFQNNVDAILEQPSLLSYTTFKGFFRRRIFLVNSLLEICSPSFPLFSNTFEQLPHLC